MDNFRRASLYVKELPVNARRLVSSDLNNTIIKKIFIPYVSDISSLSDNEFDNSRTDLKFKFINGTNYTTLEYGTYVTDGFGDSNSLTPLDVCFTFLGNKSQRYLQMYSKTQWADSGGNQAWYHTIPLIMFRNTKFITYQIVSYSNAEMNGLVPSELYDETFTLDNPLYIVIDTRQLSPDYRIYPYIKFTANIWKYPIYIEPVE